MIFSKLLINTNDNHRKFYEFRYDTSLNNVYIRYGRIGSSGVTNKLTSTEANRRYYEKINKGYKEVPSGLLNPGNEFNDADVASLTLENIIKVRGWRYVLSEVEAILPELKTNNFEESEAIMKVADSLYDILYG